MVQITQKKNHFFILFFVLILSLFASATFAVPYELQYSGRITASDGAPLEGPVDIEVKFFRTETLPDEVSVTVPTFTATPLDEGVFRLSINLAASDFHAVFSDSGDS